MRLLRWLMAPSKIPDAPPMWVTILVFGVVWNLVAGHMWVVCLSLVLMIAAFFARRLRLMMGNRRP